jgi:DNA-binding transcriptional regulator YiaG
VTNSVIHGRGLGRTRRLHGLSAAECAARAGVTVERWRDWEAGQDWPTEIEIRRVFPVGRETLMRLGAAEPDG